MSTFYGNFTDNSKPSFQFDRIYPNYTIMKLLEKSDGIFVGRQILIEYDLNPIDFFLKYASDSNFNDFFISKNISFSENNTIVEINGNTWTNNKTKEECYNLNETIDATAIYDSTVWEKIYTTEDGQKYIKIANLNAVIPTLQINNINPTTSMEITSTGVPGSDYYKLDIPKNWNFGVKEIDYYEAPLNDSTITGTISDDINYIKVEPNEDADTQELSIHLPAIGNAVAKMNKVIAEMGTSNDTSNSATNATWWAKFKYFDEITQNRQFLTEAAADNKYLTKADATGTTFTDLYLTKADATSSFENYFTKAEINNSTTGFVRRDEINNLSSSIQQIEEDTSTTNNYASDNSWLDISRTNNDISISHKKANVRYYDTTNQEIKYFGGATGNRSDYYDGVPFFIPQFNIDAAGHITNITNHSYLITGTNWIENNQSYPDSSTTGHVLNTISHKIQPQLENKVSEILEGETQPSIITYGGKINNNDEKIYIPSFNLDQAGHITDINNSSELMDMLFYKEGDNFEHTIINNNEITTTYQSFPAFGYITNSLSRLYIFVILNKTLLPGYTVQIQNRSDDDILGLQNLRFLCNNARYAGADAGTAIDRYISGCYLYTGGLKRTIKEALHCEDYTIQSNDSTTYGKLTLEGQGNNVLKLIVDIPTTATRFYPAGNQAGAASEDYIWAKQGWTKNGQTIDASYFGLINNSNFFGQIQIKGQVIKTLDGNGISRYEAKSNDVF